LNSDDLLRPTLSEYRQSPALYNSTGMALAAFFGGPLGAGVYGAANTFRLGRLSQDLPLLLALVAAAFLLPYELHRLGVMQPIAGFLDSGPQRSFEILLRALGLGCFGAIYLMHRRFFRAAQVAGAESLQGWIPGIAAVVLGFAANTAFIAWILKHH